MQITTHMRINVRGPMNKLMTYARRAEGLSQVQRPGQGHKRAASEIIECVTQLGGNAHKAAELLEKRVCSGALGENTLSKSGTSWAVSARRTCCCCISIARTRGQVNNALGMKAFGT